MINVMIMARWNDENPFNQLGQHGQGLEQVVVQESLDEHWHPSLPATKLLTSGDWEGRLLSIQHKFQNFRD